MNTFRYPLEEIRDKCDLVEIISAHVALRKSGRTLMGLCPFHNEKTPSFHVNPERQIWKCFGCDEHGDVFSFVQKIDNLTFPEAVEQIARKVGVTIERSEKAAREYSERDRILHANNIACAFYRGMLEKAPRVKEYLARRGMTESTVEKFRLGYAPASWDELTRHLAQQRVSVADAVKAGLLVARESSTGFYDRFRDRLMFPILDASDRVIAFGGRILGEGEPKYLNSPETPVFIKTKTLYGLSSARKAIARENRLLVVEGYMDVITAQAAGFENTVATLGTALTPEHVNVIARFTTNVILSFDADSAGMNAALRSAPIFEQAGFAVRILNMPNGEDPDSMLRGGDTSRFAALIEKALPIPDFRIKLALAKQDMKTDEGKTAALREAAGIIAELDSVMEQERLIRLLARYHPNFRTGTTLAEDHLRKEVQSSRTRSARQAKHQEPVGQKREAGNAGAAKLSLVERSERLLLGIILFRHTDTSKVFVELPPKDFSGDATRALAEALNSQYVSLGKIDQEELRETLAGTPAEDLMTDLVMTLDDAELNHPVGELISVIVNHSKNEKRQRYRALAQKLQEGLIKHGDEEYEEYCALVRETSGPWRR